MEDLNMIAADCLVISCCCECLLLQIVIFIFLRLPHKMIRKTRAYTKKRFRRRKKRIKRSLSETRASEKSPCDRDPPLRVQVEEFLEGIGEFRCMQEVDKVLDDLTQKGEFGFGSFWGRGETADASAYAYCLQS